MDLPPVELASLPVATLAVWLMYKLAGNHIKHASEEMNEALGLVTKAVKDLETSVRVQTMDSRDFHSWFRGWVREERKNNANEING